MVVVDAKIGAEGSVKVELNGGSLSLTAAEDTPGAKISITASLPLVYWIDQGAQKANSPLVSSVAAIIDGVLKSMP